MFCPNCGTYADSNFCPNCGKDLRKVVIKKSGTGTFKQQGPDYSKYMQYYPNTLEAIKILRLDTGMKLVEAKAIIDDLFETNNMPEKSAFKHSSEQRAASATSENQFADTIDVDVFYYANRYYPNKAEAIRALRQLGVSDADSRNAIEKAFREIAVNKRYKEKERQEKAQKTVKAVGRGAGMAAFATGALGFRVISNLVKTYTKKR